jgi:hypothetical protein
LYVVHLESSFTIDLNAGFVHIMLPEEEDDNQDKCYNNDCIIDRQENEIYGHVSSYEDLDDDEDDDCTPWPLEILHNAFQNFACSPHRNATL